MGEITKSEASPVEGLFLFSEKLPPRAPLHPLRH